ncbi:hypothetical protein D9601_03475 [Sphingomonas sp. MA1305]|uniref:hypothetical protein n=1 Tax=Sphingomonas sp. MA1305 TaxID=2479204 RepID=UPI0018DF9D0D|nr:hypothetical protein [Sphingomonas sp. MA1305]MBI0474425.1 hypothetical protein [Sphingomonas sp. MA1305]
MRLTRKQLAFRALVALEEVADQVRSGEVVPRSHQLRFLLAFLHHIATPDEHNVGDRAPFDAFWRAATRNDPGTGIAHAHQNGRGGDVGTAITAISRRIGLPITIDMGVAIAHALRGRPPHAHQDHDDQVRRVLEMIARS